MVNPREDFSEGTEANGYDFMHYKMEDLMKTWLLGMLVTGLAFAADPLPYDLEKAKKEGCLVGTALEKGISAEEKKLCAEAVENIAYALRYSFGVGERPEEDGCELGNLKMHFIVSGETNVKLEKDSNGGLRANIVCYPEGKNSDMYYADYDPAKKEVTKVTYAGL